MNVSTDACILINLLRAHRLDLLGAVPPYVFCVPTEALGEITHPDQQARLQEALDRGWIQETRMEAIEELQIFTQANEQLGSGESACLALAQTRTWILGTDDSKGVKWRKVISASGIQVLNTPGILLLAIRQGVLTIDQADEIKALLEANRFRMGFASFRDLMDEVRDTS
jgi:predicted nucleic acid-binding protein